MGRKEPLKKHIAAKWHIITLEEANEYLDSEYLKNRFYVTHCGGVAILLNKDTFHQDIKVTSFYLHDTRDAQQQDVKEGESGWVLQGVTSRHRSGDCRATTNRSSLRCHYTSIIILPRNAVSGRSSSLQYALRY